METIQIEKIKVGDNIRKDHGDLTELTASIKEHGMRKPIELTTSNLLVDGYRRLKAAKAAGLKEVPFFHWDGKIDTTTSQMLAGIFQKNLNLVEEGKAFRNYMDKTKTKIEALAKRISKQVDYVKKRLLLVNLSKDIQKALIEKKILMGHALLLAKLTKQDSPKFLREIVREKYSVERARENLQYSGFSSRLSEAAFDKSKCKGCKFNGSEQAELFETGTILNGTCMNPGCYQKKLKEFIKQKKEEFKDVLFKGDRYETPKGYQDVEYSYALEEKGITKVYMNKCRKDREDYLVRIGENGSIKEYFKIPTKKEKTIKGAEKARENKRADVLMSRVNDFKKEFLIKKSIEFMRPGTKQAKALTLIKLMRSANWDELGDFNKIFKIKNIKNIYDLRELTIDTAISYLSRKAFRLVDLKELIEISRSFKVDIKKHFKITKEYLELYTKDQLIELIEEFKIYVDAKDPKVKTINSGNIKKGELIQHILNQKLKGKVPKILL